MNTLYKTIKKESGRSPNGLLRNFAQMGDEKLAAVLAAVRLENNDTAAIASLEKEYFKRNPLQGKVVNVAEELKALDNKRLDIAKKALNDTLSEVFKNLKIESISWGQKYTEYNDEGMYEGVSGPVVNVTNEGDPWEWQDKICYHPDAQPEGVAKEVRLLEEVLNAIGAKTLCDIIGGDEYVVTATREKPVYSFKLKAESTSY